MSAPISDADLIAYHHGRLPSDRAHEVELAIEREPEVSARYAALETEVELLSGALSSAFAPPWRAAVAARIRSAVRPGDAPGQAPARMDLDMTMRPSMHIAWQALAASLILACGVAGGYALSSLGSTEGATTQVDALQVARQESRHAALEFVASGSAETRVADDQEWMVEVTPIRTFRNASGAFCREFIEIWQLEGATSGEVGVACRQQEGGWRNVASYAVD